MRNVRMIASCFELLVVEVAAPPPSRRRRCCCCCEDLDIRIGSEQTGSGALPISGSRKSMTEEATFGAGARMRLQSISGSAAAPIDVFEGGGGICKGLYAFSWRQVVSFAGSESLVTSWGSAPGAYEIHQ